MILLQDTSWGAGPRGSAAGNNYPINESISAKRGLGYGWIGLEDGGGYGMDENVSNDIACLYAPLTFEHLVTNAALTLTWRGK